MGKLSAWIQKVSTGKVVLVTLAIFIAFTALALPVEAARVDDYNKEVGSVDTRFYYSPNDLFRIAEAYGEKGRQDYVRARWTFDVIWPLVYTVFLATAMSYLLTKAFSHQGGWQLLNLLPVSAMIFDFLENAAASGVMLAYPDQPFWMAWLASVFTPIKWVLVGDSFALVMIGLVAWGVSALKKKPPVAEQMP
jgi:hypothetical protein